MNNRTFDGPRGERAKQAGMDAAADRRKRILEIARDIAVDIAMRGDGTCNADDVGRVLEDQHGITTLGPAAGSLFKTPDWEFTGIWVKSARASNHSRMIRVWRLV